MLTSGEVYLTVILDARNREGHVPWLSPDPEEDKDLHSRVDEDLTDDASQYLLGDQTSSRPFGMDLGVR